MRTQKIWLNVLDNNSWYIYLLLEASHASAHVLDNNSLFDVADKPFPFLHGTIHNLMLLITMPDNMTLHVGCQFRNIFSAGKMETKVLKLVLMKSPFPLLMVFIWNFIFACSGS